MTLSNELKIGLVVIAALVVAFFGFRFMNDEPLLSSVNLLNTKFDNVDGLLVGSTVTMNGFKVGSVRDMIYIADEDSVHVEITITEPIPIPVGSVALLAAPDILGATSIEIVRTKNAEIVDWGGYIKGEQTIGLLSSFSDQGAALADTVQSTLTQVNKLLRGINEIEEGASSQIEATVDNFKEVTDVVSEVITARKTEIDSLIVATNNTLQNISELSDSSSADLESLVANLEQFSNDLDELSQSLQESTNSLNSILSKVDEGDGTIGLMLNDPSLYNNLDSLTFNLNELILNIQENPGDYLKYMRLIEIF
ncbi:MAG: MlaD family protein [Balneolaceae bacterium]